MRKKLSILVLCILAVGLLGCESRTDKTDSGGVILSITSADGFLGTLSVNAVLAVDGGNFIVERIELENIPKNPTGTTSALMNVELRSYEVIFTRGDTGTRLPPTYTSGVLGVVPVGGTLTIDGLPVMGLEQFTNVPLSDLLFVNGGFDKETGSELIVLNLRLRFFGRTLSGDPVESGPAYFTLRFVP